MLEANFDGLVGPTHNYAGLAHGNVASQRNGRRPSNPRAAALQGLEKMRLVADLGIPQAVLPPPLRPNLDWLRSIGFTGKDGQVLERVAQADPVLLAAAWSASSMWTANAATFSPSADTSDGNAHVTPANLAGQIHRALEAASTAALLKRVFPGPGFIHHFPLPAGRGFGDEGAANHIRLALASGSARSATSDFASAAVPAGNYASAADPFASQPGLEIFVYGTEFLSPHKSGPRRFPPRQTLEASRAVARLHGLLPERTLFLRQHPSAIDAGVFHNDVIAVGNGPVLFAHEKAFADGQAAFRSIRKAYSALGNGEVILIVVKSREVSLEAAVSTYLFNSQLLTLPQGGMLLLAAEECRRHRGVRAYLASLPDRGLGITRVEFADLRQSMRNGGGPACLRLRAQLTAAQWARVPTGLKFTPKLHQRLADWVHKHYRDRLTSRDLVDPELMRESFAASRSLANILGLGPF